MMDFSWKGLGMMKGIKVFNALKSVIPDANIETFPILFKAVATDLNYEEEVVLDFGSMYDAIRASIAARCSRAARAAARRRARATRSARRGSAATIRATASPSV